MSSGQKVKEYDMIFAVIVALVIGVPINYYFFGGKGALDFAMTIVFVPKALEAIIAIGIETEAELSGFRSAGHHWKSQWKQLLMLLTLALGMRGLAIYLVGIYFGLTHALIVAAGLIATDPAAMGIALGLVKIKKLDSRSWLLTVESLLNDVIALIAFQLASGEDPLKIIWTVILTVVAAGLLALADTSVRWLIRIRFLRNHRYEAHIETAAVAAVYISFILIGIRAELSLIGMAAMGAILSNYVEDLLPHERSHVIHKQRVHLMERWSQFGLGTVLFLVTLMLPLSELTEHPLILIISSAILVAIFIVRSVYDFVGALRGKDKPHYRLRARLLIGLISSFAANTLLGVPSVVAAELLHRGFAYEATVVFATITMSWPIILVSVILIWILERDQKKK